MKLKKYSYVLVFVLMLLIGINSVYAGEPVNCEKMFGSASDPESLRSLINEILQIPKIVVPIIIIVLGLLDFGKAVMASKEDEMRKAQSTFIKRVLIGVAVFFVPTIVDLLMYLADIVFVQVGINTGQCIL